ncbi:MAG: RES domain-containing protein, partial [Boseongicola sp.]|nr:RES domain-containing protein [Boseongicola sp.]
MTVLTGGRFAGTACRAHNPRWSWSPLSGDGAAKHGGRFNPIGVPALYTSFKVTTALLEASALGRPFQPLTLVAYQVDAGPLFDGRDAHQLSSLGFRPSDLADPDWESLMLDGREPVQHRFVADVRAAGHVGVVVPSFA